LGDLCPMSERLEELFKRQPSVRVIFDEEHA
jgi:hypothetical protein